MSLTAFVIAFVPQSLPPVQVPPENPMTTEKALLGMALFWDEQLSSTNTVACGTCHIPSAGGSDPRTDAFPLDSTHPGPDGLFGTADDKLGSRGVPWHFADGRYQYDPVFGLDVRVTDRHAPSMINAAHHNSLFWDGRASSMFRNPLDNSIVSSFGAALESQALGPILSAVEMGHEGRRWPEVTSKLARIEPLALAENLPARLAAFVQGRKYPELFARGFAGQAQPSEITPVRIAQAIATYERTLISDQTPFDRWLNGDLSAFSAEEKRGESIFSGVAQCGFCHFGGFTFDSSFHNVGVRPPGEDLGRYNETGQLFDRGTFKTPGLRNLALRQHYFHNGQATSIAEVVDHYDVGGVFLDNISPQVTPLGLTSNERSDLIAFLTTGLLDQRVANELPPFDRPTLYAESSTRRPTPFGSGTPGAFGEEPRMVAIEPAFLGNSRFALGLTHPMPGLVAFLGTDMQQSPTPGYLVMGATVNLGLSASFALTAPLTLLPDGNGGGWTSLVAAIPDNPTLSGVSVFGQWFVLDPQAAGGVAASQGLEVPIF